MIDKTRRSVQVAIVGGGVIGTSVARELSKYRLDVLLVEKRQRWVGVPPKRTVDCPQGVS